MAHGLRYFISLRITASHCHPDLPKWLVPRLHRALHSRLPLSLRVPTVLSYRSTGISTCCPSATTLVLALGPDLPRADQLYSGNLGYSAIEDSHLYSRYSFRHSLFHAVHSSLRYCFFPHAMLLYQPFGSLVSVARFSPGHFRRRTSRPVSYYALFEWMAASEPTSWLSSKSHILFHLTRTWGP